MPRKNPETKFKEKVYKDLETLKNTWYYKTQEVSRRGILDLILCVNGAFVSLELKVDSKLSELQKRNIFKINKANGFATHADPNNWKEIFQKLKQMEGI